MRAWLARLDHDVSRALGVFVLACLAYLPALTGTLVWDDDAHITRGALQDLDGLRRIWFELGATQQYYPVLHSAFWLEHRLWGESVVGYHLANVALHAFAACLIVVLCQRLAIRGAWWAALLFLLHPVAVESVAWISEQKNTLSLVFYLLAAIGWQQFDAQRRRRDWALATLLFAAALATKTVTATLPGALLVIVWWQRGRIEFRRDVVPLLPWIAMATAGGLTTAWVERHVIGASGAEFALDGWQRVLLAAHAVWHYLATVAWPFGLVFMYPRWTIDPRAAASYDYLVAVALIVVTLFILQVRTRAPLAAFLIFAGSLFPVMGFLNVYPFRYSFVADHFQYHASIALFVLAGAGLSMLLQRAQRRRGAVYAMVIVVFGALGALTWRHAADFRDAETLYRATLARNPSSWMAHHNLGRLVSRKPGGLDEAIAHFDSALVLKPDHARAHYALGVALHRVGRGAEAVPHFEAAIRLEPGNPLLVANAHYLLGQLLRERPGALEQAIAHMKEAVRLKGTVAESHNTLGEMQLAAGHPEEARREFAEALRLQPDYAAAQANLKRLDASSSLPRSR